LGFKKVGLTILSRSLPRKFLTAFLCSIVVVGLYSVHMLTNFENDIFLNFGNDAIFFLILFTFWAYIIIFTCGVTISLLIDFLIDNLSLRFSRLYKMVMYIFFGMLGNLFVGEADSFNPLGVVILLIFFGIDELLQIKKKVI
jgi:hypothetical protein